MKIENLRDIEQGEASNLKMLEKFIELNDLVTVEKGSKKLPVKYLDNRCISGKRRIFKNSKGETFVTIQEYLKSNEKTEQMTEWCLEYNMAMRIYKSEFSWYYPHRTKLFVITKPGIEVVYEIPEITVNCDIKED